ncbi:uncharacterized protein CELE_C24H12.18 [Caenorhabditis elegans]|uniref:Uncharacterized protein n=1 Tax=Caenorhabditis elegans TaxID=6239 RepID=A0A8S4Q9B4_CAEEL|nr:Uncharacterized protein CELE_C24H12.18 [Caenorhabditis elegans]CAH2169155.1 Uncharacterized protein CELE_C24H12.18 [Caenorhabditis elegans]
MCSYKNKIE